MDKFVCSFSSMVKEEHTHLRVPTGLREYYFICEKSSIKALDFVAVGNLINELIDGNKLEDTNLAKKESVGVEKEVSCLSNICSPILISA